MNLLADLPSGELLSSGIYPGLKADSAPFWMDAENVVFDNMSVRKTKGLLGLVDLAATPRGLASTKIDTESRLFVGAGNTAYRYRTSDGLTTIGSFTSSGGIYQFVPWDTWALISNGVDPVELWQNTGTSAAITAPFNRANVLFKYQLQAFAGGTNNGGSLVEWSAINDITNWTVTATGSAGNLDLRELEGDIVCAKPLASSIGIYSNANAGLFTFIGGTNLFGFRRPIWGVSAISPYSVVPYGSRHYGITQSNVFVTDLSGYAYIDEPAVRAYIEENANWDRLTEVYGWPDYANSMVRWAIPSGVSGFIVLGYRVDTGTWTRFNDGTIAGEQAGPFTNMFLAKTDRLLRRDPTTYNNDTLALDTFAQSKPLDLGSRNRIKRISKITLNGEWSGTVNFRIGFTESPNDTPTWALTTPMANSIYPDQYNVECEGAYMHVRIESSGTGSNWNLTGGQVFGELTGYVS